MHHSHDDQFSIGNPVVNHVAFVEMRPQTRLDEVAARAYLGVVQKRLEPVLYLMNEARCRVRRVYGDESPNLSEVVFRRFGYVEGKRSFDIFCPLRMILSASKALARPPAIS
jgi:hypothetical protein